MNFVFGHMFVFALVLSLSVFVFAQSSLPPLPIADSTVVKNLNVKNTEIRDLLQGMAVQYGLNFSCTRGSWASHGQL